MHRTAMSAGGQLPTGKTDRAGNANGKQQPGNEASRSRLQQIARAIISQSLHYRRQLQPVGNFGGSVFDRSPIPSKCPLGTLSLQRDRSVGR